MDLKQIKELMSSMEKAKIKKLQIKTEKGFEVMLEKEGEEPVHREPVHIHDSHPFLPMPSPPSAPKALSEEAPSPLSKEKGVGEKTGNYVTSPMVGTCYASPSPDDPPFVKVGDEVDENTIVCIIEAMKVMNEVKSGMKGKIAEILVENGHPVEFGTQLVRIV